MKDLDLRRRKGRKCGWLATLLLGLPSLGMAQSYSRTDQVVYHDNTSLWVLGQVASSTNTNTGVTEFRAEFDAAKAVPLRYYGAGTASVPGKLVQTLTYNADGTVATVKDGNNNVTTLSNWKRGIPQSIRYPATAESPSGATQSAVVNDSGWITSVTDENGYVTGYGYDAMGRLASIAYPTGDTTAWNTETFTFTPIQHDEHGLAPGHWTMRRRLGNRHINTYYDALWRPVLEESLDSSDIAGTLSQVVKRYDAHGRIIFQSYPKRGVDRPNESQGVHTIYDALGRVTSSSQDSELGLLTTLTEYLPGFQTRVTNPRGFQTVTQYQAFDQPTYDFPSGITQYSGADTSATEIHRDMFGKPQRIRKRNADGSLFADRHYVYQADQQLCKIVEPETGATVLGYDFAGNLTHSATGLYGYGDLNACNQEQAWLSGRVVSRTYDSRNRLQVLTFPDGRGNQSWEYWPDGLPHKITTHNDALNAGVVENTYTYNKRRLLTGESSGQPGWYTWGIGYGYDGNGSLSTQTYPTGLVISYGPNALGQATRASDQTGYSYAHGATYYPNGALKQFTYANGLTHSMAQNARQLPDRVTASGLAMDFSYRYDANGNVNQIYDHVPDMIPGSSPKYRLMEYDGLDRLTAAGSAMFGGDHWHRFTYNALDNMTSWKLGGVKDYAEYVYNVQNRLTNIKNSAGASIVGLEYDPQGNLANKNGQEYQFDYGNRLRVVTGKEHYRYDGHGRRVLAWDVASTRNILSIYGSSGQMLYEENNRPNAQRATEHVYFAGSVIASRDRNIVTNAYEVKFKHTDALGSPVAVTNQAGTVIERNDYEPYGAIIGKSTYQGVGYTGHVQDAATGLTYMQQRYYDPAVGRFLSVDPVSADQNSGALFNRYMYAANNPYRFFDPDGRCTGSRITNSNGTCRSTGGFTTMATGARSASSSSARLIAQAIPIPRLPPPIPMTGVTPDESGKTIGEQIVDAYRARQERKTHVTYTLTKPGYPRDSTYVGRASGYGTPEQVMMQRYSSHGMRLLGYVNPTLDVSAIGESGRLAIRGREQQMIDAVGGVGSDFVGNRIRAVSPINPFGRVYHEAANAEFGNIAPYTGW